MLCFIPVVLIRELCPVSHNYVSKLPCHHDEIIACMSALTISGFNGHLVLIHLEGIL